ncbi:MAG: 4'-phosphopantetheinyl transferase superfamily protein [Pseudobutyrivibrio sp.]|nr:4'-phosphopantetheinyl transferase superfamily protein [Pseudobutyrivibrio sp.]
MKNTDQKWLPKHNKLLKYVSSERQEKIYRYKFDSDKVNSLYAALLTRLGITRILGNNNSELEFEYQDNHKPKLAAFCHSNAKDIDFSFSHTKGAVLAGITTNESIGVDIEEIKDAPFDIMKMVFHPEEISYVTNQSKETKTKAFFEVWTKKEAYTKCLGTGLVTNLKALNTLQAPISDNIETWVDDNYICSVCTIKS